MNPVASVKAKYERGQWTVQFLLVSVRRFKMTGRLTPLVDGSGTTIEFAIGQALHSLLEATEPHDEKQR